MFDVYWRDYKFVLISNLFILITGLIWRVDVRFFLLFYWMENIVAGLFNVLKMILANGDESPVVKIFTVPFFIVHYGVFNAVHLVFLFVFIGLFDQSINAIEYVFDNFWLFSMNLAFLVVDYILDLRGWLRFRGTAMVGELMFRPYGRIVALHMTILLGAFLYFVFYSSQVFLVILMVMKTLLDINIRQRA